MSERRIVIVDTAPRGQRGSMTRYGDHVQRALGGESVERVRIALPDWAGNLLGPRLGSWLQHGWRLAVGRAWLASKHADLYHILDGSFAYVAEGLDPARCVVTCHDLIPRLQVEGRIPGRPGPAAVRIMNRSLRVLAKVRHVVAVSENTRQDAIRLAGVDPARISVVPNALVPDWFYQDLGDTTVVAPAILHIGNNASYKNRAGVIRIAGQVRATTPVRLVMVGAPLDKALLRLADRSGLAQDIEWLATVPEEWLNVLYRSASLLLFPSLYEGFGWPVLEAMACGCPVVCSNAASLPEVVGEAALMAPADDEAALAAHCVALLTDPALRSRCQQAGLSRAAGFTLSRFGEGLRKAYSL